MSHPGAHFTSTEAEDYWKGDKVLTSTERVKWRRCPTCLSTFQTAYGVVAEEDRDPSLEPPPS